MSSFVRAYDTVRLLPVVIGPTLKVETREELAAGAKPEQVIALLRTLPSDAVVVCVEDEPQLGEVVNLLLCRKVFPNFRFKKTGAVCVIAEGVAAVGQEWLNWVPSADAVADLR